LLCDIWADEGTAARNSAAATLRAAALLETVGNLIDVFHSFVILYSIAYLTDDVLGLSYTNDVKAVHVPVTGQDRDGLQAKELLKESPVLLVVNDTVQLHIVSRALENTMQENQLLVGHDIFHSCQIEELVSQIEQQEQGEACQQVGYGTIVNHVKTSKSE
jgi:hypothetical protein